ncbi:beta-glucan synthesis-associated [Favolaschia claudopus]|uniref:Beta-glucan synthesis-associated n=1 Tax=Favolaschia claudopus TaxID=2862362 RepID=A0AAW0AIF3_9AGAR
MDGFDDLLAQSQSSLETNPFADPFSKRSSSPDPWSSPFARQASSDEDNEPPETPVDEPPASESVGLNPLDGPLAPHSPGFRESLPESEPGFSEIATIRPSEPEELQPSIPVPEDDNTTPIPATPPPRALSESTPSFARVPRPRIAVGDLRGSRITGAMTGHRRRVYPTDDDSDDDKPILQTVRQPPPERADTIKPGRDGLPPVFVISVDDPQKVGDPIRSFTMYTVHTRVHHISALSKSAFSVLRRYSDFLWLFETLSNNNPGVVVPPVPEKNPFGRFDDQFVRQRRYALEKCIHKIANHPVLGKDPDLKLFLESDTFSLDVYSSIIKSGGLMATIGQSIAGPRFYETDETKNVLDSLEAQLRGLVKAIELVSKQRTVCHQCHGLSQSDVGKQLAQTLGGLADVERKAQDLQGVQAEQDIVTLLSTVDEYARLINSVRVAFNSRIRTYHSWRAAEADLVRVKQNHERNRAQGRIQNDRVGYALAQISDSERRALDAKHDFDQATKLIKTEMARFEQERGMIGRQKELIATWENYQQTLLKRVGGGRGLPPGAPQQSVPVA